MSQRIVLDERTIREEFIRHNTEPVSYTHLAVIMERKIRTPIILSINLAVKRQPIQSAVRQNNSKRIIITRLFQVIEKELVSPMKIITTEIQK